MSFSSPRSALESEIIHSCFKDSFKNYYFRSSLLQFAELIPVSSFLDFRSNKFIQRMKQSSSMWVDINCQCRNTYFNIIAVPKTQHCCAKWHINILLTFQWELLKNNSKKPSDKSSSFEIFVRSKIDEKTKDFLAFVRVGHFLYLK